MGKIFQNGPGDGNRAGIAVASGFVVTGLDLPPFAVYGGLDPHQVRIVDGIPVPEVEFAGENPARLIGIVQGNPELAAD